MAYQVWSVVFGEQPSASKWNILGTNDAGFNDGTAIADNAIIARHIADLAVSNAQMAADTFLWEKLASTNLAAPATQLLSGTFTARKYLRIILDVRQAAALDTWVQVNGDTGSNYNYRWYSNNVSASTGVSQAGFTVSATSNAHNRWIVIDVVNVAAIEKLFRCFVVEAGTAGAANLTNTTKVEAKWANTASQVTSVRLFNNLGNNMAAGTTMLVLGHD